jgi:hypothetical protein
MGQLRWMHWLFDQTILVICAGVIWGWCASSIPAGKHSHSSNTCFARCSFARGVRSGRRVAMQLHTASTLCRACSATRSACLRLPKLLLALIITRLISRRGVACKLVAQIRSLLLPDLDAPLRPGQSYRYKSTANARILAKLGMGTKRRQRLDDSSVTTLDS